MRDFDRYLSSAWREMEDKSKYSKIYDALIQEYRRKFKAFEEEQKLE